MKVQIKQGEVNLHVHNGPAITVTLVAKRVDKAAESYVRLLETGDFFTRDLDGSFLRVFTPEEAHAFFHIPANIAQEHERVGTIKRSREAGFGDVNPEPRKVELEALEETTMEAPQEQPAEVIENTDNISKVEGLDLAETVLREDANDIEPGGDGAGSGSDLSEVVKETESA